MLSLEAVRLNASTISLTLLFLAGFYLIYRDMRRIEESIQSLGAALSAQNSPLPPDFLEQIYMANKYEVDDIGEQEDELDCADFEAEDPVAEDPVAEDPVAEDPVAEDPVAEDPVAEDPVEEFEV